MIRISHIGIRADLFRREVESEAVGKRIQEIK